MEIGESEDGLRHSEQDCSDSGASEGEHKAEYETESRVDRPSVGRKIMKSYQEALKVVATVKEEVEEEEGDMGEL